MTSTQLQVKLTRISNGKVIRKANIGLVIYHTGYISSQPDRLTIGQYAFLLHLEQFVWEDKFSSRTVNFGIAD